MLSEQAYRQKIDEIFTGSGPNWAQGGAEWNNQMILSLAIHGLVLLPYPHDAAQPPFKHYIEMPHPSMEGKTDANGYVHWGPVAWTRSWVVDADWEEHYKPPLKFNFTPLTKV